MNRTITSKATSFTDVSFEVHQDRPGLRAETFFLHRHLNLCHTIRGVATQAAARDRGGSSERFGLHTAPLVLRTASASPEAVCFELRHFCREGKRENGCQRYVVG